MIDQLIKTMVAEVKSNGLELLARYPDDLLVHDRRFLQEHLVEGVSIAWVVGHSHTHCALVGISDEQSDLIWHLSALSQDDVFYRIDIKSGKATLKKLSRDQFTDLSKIKPAYTAVLNWDFEVKRNGKRVGFVQIEPHGSYQTRTYECTVSPDPDATAKDVVALTVWAKRAIARQHGSLFWSGNIVVKTEKELCNEH
jgi:hypothetical protein